MLRSERRIIFGPQKRRKTETDDICFTYGKNGEGKGGQSLGRRKTMGLHRDGVNKIVLEFWTCNLVQRK